MRVHSHECFKLNKCNSWTLNNGMLIRKSNVCTNCTNHYPNNGKFFSWCFHSFHGSCVCVCLCIVRAKKLEISGTMCTFKASEKKIEVRFRRQRFRWNKNQVVLVMQKFSNKLKMNIKSMNMKQVVLNSIVGETEHRQSEDEAKKQRYRRFIQHRNIRCVYSYSMHIKNKSQLGS